MKYIKISGIIELPNETSMDDFIDKFIKLVESEGGYFLGGFNPNINVEEEIDKFLADK